MRARTVSFLLAVWMSAPHDAAAVKSFQDVPALSGMRRATLRNGHGDRLDVIGYLTPDSRPTVVVIPGSLCAPVFVSLDKGKPTDGFATVPVLAAQDAKELGVHVLYLERRNMVSLETLASLPAFSIADVTRLSPCTDRNGGVTLEQRVEDVLTQVRWIKAQHGVRSIHLVGLSEGGDVAAAVAASASRPVDSVMLIGSAGPSQFVDFVTDARKKGDSKGLRNAFSELDQFLRGTPPKTYRGSSARRWQSFALDNSSLNLLSRSDVPVFIAHGERDESVPVTSADVAAVELMVHQPRRPIYYWSVKGSDHALVSPTGSRMWAVLREYVTWATSRPAGRKVRTD